MATAKTNIWNIKAGDQIAFTNNRNFEVTITVARVTKKSWYAQNGGRNSFGTLAAYMGMPNARIIRN